jgi:carboxylate-amine ligase
MEPTDGVETQAADAEDNFARMGTLGVEEEFFVVDAEGWPTDRVDALVDGEPPAALAGSLDREAYDCTVETKTEVCPDLDAVERQVGATREALVEHAARHGLGVAAAGLHPAVDWRDHGCSDERYRAMRDRLRYPQWRNTTAGLHVHVGVDDPDKAVWIANQVRWYLPVMLALSANSPFYEGLDTGLASARAKVFGELPRTGVPPAFESFDDYAGFERTLLDTGSIRDPGEVWYDVRPHAEHGTVEVRAPDAQTRPDRVAALVEYVHALVTDLGERWEDGEDGRDYRRALLAENRWRAARHGHDASFLQCDGAGVVALGTVVDRECDRLGVSGIRRLLRDGSGAAEQRCTFERGGLDAVCTALRLRPETTVEESGTTPARPSAPRALPGQSGP